MLLPAILFFILVGAVASPLILVRYKAATKGTNEIPLYGGIVKYVTWEPQEGIIILRDKKKYFVNQSGEGGSKFIFSLVGDEALPRISLSTSSIDWENEEITTKESIQVTLKCIIMFRVFDVYKYHYGADKAKYISEKNRNAKLFDVYEGWIRAQADSVIRTFSSRASVSELVSFDSMKHNNHQNEELRFSDISNQLLTEFNKTARDFLDEVGIRINKIDVQSIKINGLIQDEINKVWISHLKPVQSEQEAKARQIELESLAKTLGTDTVKLTEILKSTNLSGAKIKTKNGFASTLMKEIDKSTNKVVENKHDDKLIDE
ncbi:MAG: hypothetical protein KF775_00925 [Cyclobacteriaceae bacterium]|nr:hypothetical protein [Cyclobacteriaceae bacterium]